MLVFNTADETLLDVRNVWRNAGARMMPALHELISTLGHGDEYRDI